MLQRFNMPTQTIPMLSKKPKKATNELELRTILAPVTAGLGYMASVLKLFCYDADTLLHPQSSTCGVYGISEEFQCKSCDQQALETDRNSVERYRLPPLGFSLDDALSRNHEYDKDGIEELVQRRILTHVLHNWKSLVPSLLTVATACYTLNRSLVHTLHGKTYYELLKGKKPNLQYFRVFGSLCYPTNDYDDVGKLKAKADIGIFVGYAPTKKAYRIYNKRTRKIQETVHVAFDELTEGLTSVQTSSGLAPQQMTSHENANGSPSTTVISEGAPAVTESLLPHQIPLPDTSDSDDETLFDHVDSNVFDTYNAPETGSEASSSNSVNIDVTPNNQLPHVQNVAVKHIHLKTLYRG
ncbi:retrovirus-related pol polyprotein from transposon TNT 1-94 [Tanacetum coccineum]